GGGLSVQQQPEGHEHFLRTRHAVLRLTGGSCRRHCRWSARKQQCRPRSGCLRPGVAGAGIRWFRVERSFPPPGRCYCCARTQKGGRVRSRGGPRDTG
ncbi:unnamed protein product, partial [Amoebophrya sp. A120]